MCVPVCLIEKDEINVPMTLRDGDRSPRSGGESIYACLLLPRREAGFF